MGYYCNECSKHITKAEYDYSTEKFKRALCRGCQKECKPKTFKKRLKKEPTPEAKMLYQALQTLGVRCELEKWDGFKHIDIAVVDSKVNIEVDGAHHNFKARQALADLKRTFHSFRKGYVTLRIPNILVKKYLDDTAEYINNFLHESDDQLDEDCYKE